MLLWEVALLWIEGYVLWLTCFIAKAYNCTSIASRLLV